MPTNPLTGLPYPAGSAAIDVPADMMALVTALSTGRVLLRCTDAADRDSKFSQAGIGDIAVAPGYVWQKTSAPGTNTWLALYSDTGWQTTGFAYPDSANWGPGAYMQWRQVGQWVDVRGSAKRLGGTLTVANGGFLPDQTPVNLPTQIAPKVGVPTIGTAPTSTVSILLGASGGVVIREGVSNSTIANGDEVQFALTYTLG